MDVSEVHLIEASPRLRRQQLQSLAGIGQVSDTKYAKLSPTTGVLKLVVKNDEQDDEMVVPIGCRWNETTDVYWHQDVVEVPESNQPTLILAHEFFDALPTHQFKMTEEGWREVMVDVAPPGSDLEFRYVLSSQSSHMAQFLTSMAPKDSPKDAVWEMSPEMMRVLAACHKLIAAKGAMLLMDYGSDVVTLQPTLRGIRKHEFVHPLSCPGQTDLTVDVPFALLNQYLPAQMPSAPSMSQHDFLIAMGIRAHLDRAKQFNSSDAESLESGVDRVTGTNPGQMGSLYRFWATLDPTATPSDWFPFIK